MGVEHREDVVFFKEPPRERGGIGISNLAYEVRNRLTLSIEIRKGSGLGVDEQRGHR